MALVNRPSTFKKSVASERPTFRTKNLLAKVIIIGDEIETVKRPIQGDSGRYKMSTSPAATSRSIHDAKKSSIGEMSTNPNKKNAKTKTKQLERSCRIVVDRFNSIHVENVDACDANSVIGAAFLVTLSRRDKNRGDELDMYKFFVTSCLSPKNNPHLLNLARSRRFFVVVLPDAEAPRTTAIDSLQMQFREIYSDTDINLRKHFKRQEIVLGRRISCYCTCPCHRTYHRRAYCLCHHVLVLSTYRLEVCHDRTIYSEIIGRL